MDKKSAIVIGSGFGGLAIAIRLQSAGLKVTLLEKRDKPGGRAYVYQEGGFTFDAGPTVVTAPNCLDELFELSGRKMSDYCELLSVSPLYRLFWEDGTVFDYTQDLKSTLDQIRKLNPKDAERYPEFLKYTQEVFEEGYVKLAHVPFLDWWSMIRVAPELIKLEAYRSVYSMVSKYIEDPHLRQAFSFHSLLVGGSPFSASSIYTLIHALERKWGVYFPKGGMTALVSSLARLFTDLGGEIRYDSEVHEILTQEEKVTGVVTKSGQKIKADLVVSNADVHHTYHQLLKRSPQVEKTRKTLDKSRYSMSLFVIYFGTRRRFEQFGHHNVVFGPRYKEHLKDIFQRGVLAPDFSLYVHRPTATDSSLAPPGHENFYALSPVPHLGKSQVDWKEEGPRYGEKILEYLDKRYLPGLKDSLVVQKIFTPLDFEKELNAHWGSAFSLEPVLTQSAYFRTHNRDESLKGLYFVGAGTHPGAGIPGVVSSAKATAAVILSDLKEPIRVRAPESVVKDSPYALSKACEEMIVKGSKSFSLAAKLFDPRTRKAAFFLYGWCRYVDDAIDEISDPKIQKEVLEQLKEKTRLALEGRPGDETVFKALSEVGREYQIPSVYATELLEGMAMDVKKTSYASFAELTLYCYRVAGCVGLMMSHIMGVSDERALPLASDLGIAMQLTNIARDILTDAEMGRVYLPLGWLKEIGLSAESVDNPAMRPGIAHLTRRLLKEADKYYESGTQGLKYLPWRSALSVAVALCVYREIGIQVLKRGSRAWDSRTVVSPFRKFLCIFKGMGLVMETLPIRLTQPWKRVQVHQIWRHVCKPLELS